jgi:hypothetical protein
MNGKPIRWDELSWEGIAELRDRGMDLAILPVGATEQHGLHLPLGVDTFTAVAVAEVRAESDFAYKVGITGVPCFIANGQYAISGAQEPEGLFPIFDLAREKESVQSTA